MSSPPAQTQSPLAELQSSPIENFLATVLLRRPARHLPRSGEQFLVSSRAITACLRLLHVLKLWNC